MSLNSTKDITVEKIGDLEVWEIPPSCDTSYLTHSYYRFIGKFPPQISAKIINDFYPGSGEILDPMVGGGTTLAESVLRGIDCEGWDINPVSILISSCVTRQVDQNELENHGWKVIEGLQEINDEKLLFSTTSSYNFQDNTFSLKYCKEYFDDKKLEEIKFVLNYIKKLRKKEKNIADLFLMIVLSSLRRISYANVKKMNLELDFKKKKVHTLLSEFSRSFQKISKINKELSSFFKPCKVKIEEKNVLRWESNKKYGLILIHPPYLTNTAFSESTQLQLALLNINHRTIWKKELKYRGSFLHEPNGLRKYLVNWAGIINSASKSIKKNGILAVVVGDGQIDYVRIPIGSISIEFGKDAGLKLIKRAFHCLNMNTGQTQNRKMKGQHVFIFKKI